MTEEHHGKTVEPLSEDETELLRELRERLLNAGIVGMPYFSRTGRLYVAVSAVWRNMIRTDVDRK